MEIAAQVGHFEQRRELMFRGLNLAARLAQLGRNPMHREHTIKLLFGSRRDQFVATKQTGRVESEPADSRDGLKRRAVRLRSSEPNQRGAKALARNDSQLGAQTAAQDRAGIIEAGVERMNDSGKSQEASLDRLRIRRRDQIQVADSVSLSAEATRY